MSWHHGDWLSFAQATASTIAIFGAYGVVFLQDRLDESHNAKRREVVRSAIIEIANKARLLTDEILNPEDVYSQIGTWDQYRAFRGREFAEFRNLVSTLLNQDFAEVDLFDVAIKLRINLCDIEAVIKESEFHSLTGWAQSRRMIIYCKTNFDEISEKLKNKKEY